MPRRDSVAREPFRARDRAPRARSHQSDPTRATLADPPQGLTVYAKLEAANPGGSVKDRAARAIVLDAFQRGWLPGRRLLDATSGNTGIAYAMLGAALGFGVTLCMPSSANRERKRILRAYGAEVIETDAVEGSDGAQLMAQELAGPNRIASPTSISTPIRPTLGP